MLSVEVKMLRVEVGAMTSASGPRLHRLDHHDFFE